MEIIKKTIRRSPLYELVKLFRTHKLTTTWTGHEQSMLDFYSKFLKPGERVFDVGANIGNRTKIFLKLGARVLAVEPQQECVKLLKTFEQSGDLSIFEGVLGAEPGEAELHLSKATTIATLSNEWIEAAKTSGRFDGHKWQGTQKVQMSTLDELIDKYGRPDFIKIDVEGFEYEVLRGLSQPVKHISFEFTLDFYEQICDCIDYLSRLEDAKFNYSRGESMRLVLDNYVFAKDMKKKLAQLGKDNKLFGDIYCYFPSI